MSLSRHASLKIIEVEIIASFIKCSISFIYCSKHYLLIQKIYELKQNELPVLYQCTDSSLLRKQMYENENKEVTPFVF